MSARVKWTLTSAMIAVAMPSCGFLPQAPRKVEVNHFRADPRDFDSVRRVMVLPFHAVEGVRNDGESVRSAFQSEISKLGRFEIVPLPSRAEEHQQIHQSLTRGQLSTDALVELSTRYEIDGVLIGTLTSYRPYPPMVVGVRMQLVSLHSGGTVWAADGIYDANDARILEDIRHYSESFAANEASLHGWEINLIAPSKYAAFVAHRIAATCR